MILEYMCKKAFIFDHLENGQIPASVDFWRDFLSKDPGGALSVCRKQVEDLPPLIEGTALFESRRDVVKRGLEVIKRGAEVAVGRIPRAEGFFTSTSDRASAYRAACGFLELLKKTLLTLDHESLGLPALYSILRTRETAILQAESSVAFMQKAARGLEDRDAVEEGTSLSRTLSQYRDENLAILTNAKKLERLSEAFCAHTCREFCRFLAAKADMEHEGAGASPAELSRLLWGLHEETERLLKEI